MRVLILLILSGCALKNNTGIYGDYGFTLNGKEFGLHITTDNRFFFDVIKVQYGDMVEFENLASGVVYQVDSNTILLTDDETKRAWHLCVLSNEILLPLQPIKIKGVDQQIDQKMYCINGVFKNGKTKFSGGWCEGKKCGTWIYYNEKGEAVKEEFYEYE